MVRVATLILAAAILGVAPACAAALEVSQSQWGFDGKVVPGRIAILSVEVGNPSAAPFDGVLRLHKETGLGGRVDAPLVEPCFLSPGAARWVQFYPYVRDEHEAWVLEWGLGAKERHLLPGIEVGPPARVVLHDPDDPLASGRGVRFRPFRENLFPPTVAATDGLHSVLLDRVPRWEPVRRQAFLDWLRRGGEVHVLRTPSGRHPVFPDELAVLSSPLERHRVGAGLVLHHAMGRAEASDAALAARGCPPCQLVAPPDYAPSRIGDIEEPLFRALSDMTRPRHAWGFIYLTVVAYIVVLGPLNLLFGRKRRNYRHTLLFFLLTVAGAGVLLYFLGRRGHDEATAVNSLACARQIDADTYDVTQWVNVFVTRGATYRITHDAPHNLYSGCQDREAIRGLIANGKDGVFQVDIPLFSHRPFLHRAKLKGDHIKLDVVRWSVGERLEELVLAAEPGFPQRAAEVWANETVSAPRRVVSPIPPGHAGAACTEAWRIDGC